jgi:hypothetical protein
MEQRIDEIYRLILQSAVEARPEEEDVHKMQRAVAAIVAAQRKLSVTELSSLLGIRARSLRTALSSLHSLISVPRTDDEQSIATYHASFADYVTIRSSAERWFVKVSLTHRILTTSCLDTMLKDLHFNVCRIKSSHVENTALQQPLPGHLGYACAHWLDHWIASQAMEDFTAEVVTVFKTKFFYWVEVASVLGVITELRNKLCRMINSPNHVRE